MPERSISNLKIKLLESDQPAYVVAAKCGMHPSQLTRYALGTEQIRPGHLRALAKYFKCPQREILGNSTFVLEKESDEAR